MVNILGYTTEQIEKIAHNGFEGEWSLTLVDGNKRQFTTKTIITQGLIQRAHYHYLSHLF